MHATSNAKAYTFLIVTTLIWGGNSVAGKMSVGHVSPMALNAMRWAIAGCALALFAGPQIRRDWRVIRQHLPLLLGYGAVGFTCFNAFLYAALQHTSAINAVVAQAAIPMVIFGLNFLLFRTAVRIAQWAGFALTILGVVLTVSQGEPARLLALDLNRGDALMMAAVLVYAIYTVALRFKPSIHWQSLISVSVLGAFLAALVPLVVEMESGKFHLPDTTGWGVALFAGLMPSLISQILYVRGVEMIGPNRAGLFINLIPIFGTLLSLAFLGETLHLYHLAALALALGGIAVAEWGRNVKP
ncbi:hypothetical protein BJF93_03505 [Xaviernesmea oryzae]|uniref:EamA domain-containing protein n=1 Tax=Xaviernesmea oryzae TaxID=464029 RepID=A0A1Q9AZK1_9HYPH|nr:DMT family transporter [Xaviernesmea oryzae]OLP61126.1 hypothetical protein BJF93_03505 [Xaviernesmea oryzae]SEL12321.1 Permease of the drug/metabolite transporter (DMT) superfamily [Xaviernesmea oryzae]